MNAKHANQFAVLKAIGLNIAKEDTILVATTLRA